MKGKRSQKARFTGRLWGVRANAPRWLVMLGIGAGALAIGVVLALAVLAAHAAAAVPRGAGDKLGQVGAQANSDAASVHAPKPALTAVVQPTSCPRGPVHTGLFAADNGGFHAQIENEAVIAPRTGAQFEYIVFAGASATDAQQGLLIVVRLDVDPCAATAQGTQVRYFQTPTSTGPLTLTQITDNSVLFTSPQGGQHQFDYVSGTFK